MHTVVYEEVGNRYTRVCKPDQQGCSCPFFEIGFSLELEWSGLIWVADGRSFFNVGKNVEITVALAHSVNCEASSMMEC